MRGQPRQPVRAEAIRPLRTLGTEPDDQDDEADDRDQSQQDPPAVAVEIVQPANSKGEPRQKQGHIGQTGDCEGLQRRIDDPAAMSTRITNDAQYQYSDRQARSENVT